MLSWTSISVALSGLEGHRKSIGRPNFVHWPYVCITASLLMSNKYNDMANPKHTHTHKHPHALPHTNSKTIKTTFGYWHQHNYLWDQNGYVTKWLTSSMNIYPLESVGLTLAKNKNVYGERISLINVSLLLKACQEMDRIPHYMNKCCIYWCINQFSRDQNQSSVSHDWLPVQAVNVWI